MSSKSWFAGLLGKIYSLGLELELMQGLDFRDGLTVTPNAETKLLEVRSTGGGGGGEGDLKADGTVPLTATWPLGNQALTGVKALRYGSEINNTGSTPAINFTTGDLQKITATANCAPTFVAPVGIGWVQICFIQDSTPRTFTQPGSVIGSPPQPSTVSASRTFYQYFYDGTNYHFASSQVDLSSATAVTGTLPATRGGTGAASLDAASLAVVSTVLQVQSQLGARGTENVVVDLYPSTQAQGTLATAASVNFDVAIAAGKRYKITADVWVDDGAGGACLFSKAVAVVAHQTGGAVVLITNDTMHDNAGAGFTFVATNSGTNVRFTLSNTSGSTRSYNLIRGFVSLDKP